MSIDDLVRAFLQRKCAQTSSGTYSGRQKDIAKGVDLDIGTVRPHLVKLEKWGEFKVDRRFRPNRYTLTAAMPAVAATEDAAAPSDARPHGATKHNRRGREIGVGARLRALREDAGLSRNDVRDGSEAARRWHHG